MLDFYCQYQCPRLLDAVAHWTFHCTMATRTTCMGWDVLCVLIFKGPLDGLGILQLLADSRKVHERKQQQMNKISLPNEITPLPTKIHSLPTFSLFAQTPPFFAQTPPFFAQPSTFARRPAAPWISGSWNALVQMEGDSRFCLQLLSLSCHGERNRWQIIT